MKHNNETFAYPKINDFNGIAKGLLFSKPWHCIYITTNVFYISKSKFFIVVINSIFFSAQQLSTLWVAQKGITFVLVEDDKTRAQRVT